MQQAPTLQNKQKLKKEQWTRIIRIGDEYVGQTRLQPILPDMVAFQESPPEAVNSRERTAAEHHSRWTLFFDPKVCVAEYADKTLEEMELKQTKVVDYAT